MYWVGGLFACLVVFVFITALLDIDADKRRDYEDDDWWNNQ